MIIKMLTELGRRMDEHSENFDKELENIKKNETELKKTITKIKNTLQGLNSRLDDTEESISDLEERLGEITQSEQKKRKWPKDFYLPIGSASFREFSQKCHPTPVLIFHWPLLSTSELEERNIFNCTY